MSKVKCNLCGKKVKNSDSLVGHIKREHGKLSEKSINYLRSLGISEEKIKKFMEG